MAIEQDSEKEIHIQKVCKRFAKANGKPRSLNTVIRWIVHGVKVRGHDKLIRLEGRRVGGSWYTTEEAIERFSQSLTNIEMSLAQVSNQKPETLRQKRSRERARKIRKQKVKAALGRD